MVLTFYIINWKENVNHEKNLITICTTNDTNLGVGDHGLANHNVINYVELSKAIFQP